ncbi:4'-phosphopantetheinyl transferase family protein [Agrobacterium tumefaciens]|uniref:4'-phosphopantetheinyl transferase family protein n=1 Tax=Agrobacterium tumefaciens TaxID=358 RepID=UPI0015C32639
MFNISNFLGDQDGSLPPHVYDDLPRQEIDAANRFRLRSDMVRSILGRYLMRRELGLLLNVKPSQVCLEIGEHGKPRIAAITGNSIEFNLSHSGMFIAIATCETPVGVDVEESRVVEEVEALALHFLTPDERSAIMKSRKECRSDEFLKCWTRKEAVLKALGYGLYRDPSSVSTLRDRDPENTWIVSSVTVSALFHCAVAWLR